jgi:two-component system cell cycle response regulator
VAESRPGELDLTISAGVAAGSGGDISYDRLFRAADGALLRAKRNGRNRVETAGELPALTLPDAREFAGDPSALKT